MKQRGDVWWVNFDSSVGQEVKKKRPAIVVRFMNKVGSITENAYFKKFYDIYSTFNLSSLC